jgi:hypothetical protein
LNFDQFLDTNSHASRTALAAPISVISPPLGQFHHFGLGLTVHRGGYAFSTFINKDRDQWATVGLKRDTKVTVCLYASGIGHGSVHRRTLK